MRLDTNSAARERISAKNEDIDFSVEIAELHRENARIDSQLIRLKADITGIDTRAQGLSMDAEILEQRNMRLENYYDTLQMNLINLLEQVQLPESCGKATTSNFDTFTSNLQSLCFTDGHLKDDFQRSLYKTVNYALHNFMLPPTPT